MVTLMKVVFFPDSSFVKNEMFKNLHFTTVDMYTTSLTHFREGCFYCRKKWEMVGITMKCQR